MDAERWARVERICQEALERDPKEQATFLGSACGSDQELRREVDSLLAHQQTAENFIENRAIDVAAQALAAGSDAGSTVASRLIGRLIPPYRIVEGVASGGMGDVYRAERADGIYDKEVAIKVIQGARSTDFFLARFQNERQILATLDHPNIARLLDGGTTQEGLPYLVMEFIQGLPIDDYCETKNLDIRARLELFRAVCLAVQYAHQNLVIHRDLKPSNILVNADGAPKLLDFGVAKILDPQGGEEEPRTVTVMRMLTPDYASPEQVRNEAISTASDVYSLGVILYELLTGQSPYRVTADSPQEMMKAICDAEPEKPSTAVTRVSGQDLRKLLAGDLDNIVLKALKKEPQRRYSTVEQLSEDIRRYLVGLPVLAHPDSPAYRARKFIGRYTLAVAGAMVLILSLMGGLAATLWQARIARAERARAERRFNDVRNLAGSLIFEVHDAIVGVAGTTSARKLIVERAQQYLDSLAQEARNDPALLQELAFSYGRLASVLGDARDANLGNTTKATENYRKAVELGKSALALQPSNRNICRELASNYAGLAVTTQNPDEHKAALQAATALLEPLVATNPQDLASQEGLAKIQELNASLLLNQKDLNPALEAYQKSLVLYDRLAKADPKNQRYPYEVSFAHKHVGGVLNAMDRLDEAFEHYRQALAIDEAKLAAHPDDVNARFFITYTYNDTGLILRKRGDLDGALSYYRKALDIRAAMVAADPKDTRAQWGLASSYEHIASILFDKGDFARALESFKKSLTIRELLRQNDSANKRFQSEAALTRAYLAETYAATVAAGHISSKEKATYCQESRKLLEPAFSEYLRRQKEGVLQLGDDVDLADMQKAQQQCAAVLASRPFG